MNTVEVYSVSIEKISEEVLPTSSFNILIIGENSNDSSNSTPIPSTLTTITTTATVNTSPVPVTESSDQDKTVGKLPYS